MSFQQKRGSSSKVENVNTTRLSVSSTASIKNLIACNVQYDQLCPTPPGFHNWVVQDVKPQGEDGGDFFAPDLSGAWRTRDLNTISGPSNDHVTLSNNRLSFLPGIYHVRVRAPAFRVRQHKARFHNISLDVTEMYGTSEQAREDTTNGSEIELVLTVTDSTHLYEVQHQCDISQVVNGFGVASNFDDAEEVYTTVFIAQILVE